MDAFEEGRIMSLTSATYVQPPGLRTQWLVAILGLAIVAERSEPEDESGRRRAVLTCWFLCRPLKGRIPVSDGHKNVGYRG